MVEKRFRLHVCLGSLREYDEQLYYFVLVATYRLSDDCLFESLHEYLMREWQVCPTCVDITGEEGPLILSSPCLSYLKHK